MHECSLIFILSEYPKSQLKVISLKKILEAFILQQHCHRGFQLSIGDCPLYFEEPCDSRAIRFTLNAQGLPRRINPYYPALPRDFSVRSAAVKILVHGYGGFAIDFAIKNVSAAYSKFGYNTIIGTTITKNIEEDLSKFFSGLVVSFSSAVLRDGFFEHMARGSVCSGPGCWSAVSRGQARGTAFDRLQFGGPHSRFCW